MKHLERQTYTDHVRPALLKCGRDPVRVENPALPGTPDINYIEGWIELKALASRPARSGIIRIDHFTPQQRTWLIRRWRAGGNAFLLLRLEDTWMLFDGETAARDVGMVDEATLRGKLSLCVGDSFQSVLPLLLIPTRRIELQPKG